MSSCLSGFQALISGKKAGQNLPRPMCPPCCPHTCLTEDTGSLGAVWALSSPPPRQAAPPALFPPKEGPSQAGWPSLCFLPPDPSPHCPDLCPGAISSLPTPALMCLAPAHLTWPLPAPLLWGAGAQTGPEKGVESPWRRCQLSSRPLPQSISAKSPAQVLAPCGPAALPKAQDGNHTGPH